MPSQTTFEKWVTKLDPAEIWISGELSNGQLLSVMCKVCHRQEQHLRLCRNFNDSFINGIEGSSLKKDNLSKHAKSDSHKLALKLDKKSDTDSIRPTTGSSKQINVFDCSGSKAENNVAKLMDIAYMCAYEELPFTKYEKMITTEKKHGVKLGDTYLNDKKAAEFTECIANVLKEKTETLVKNANYFTVFMDGSTDASVVEKELIYVMAVDDEGEQSNNKLRYVIIFKKITAH